ncbi:MAG TPA: hypothetical protein ENF20_06960 [Candidatus Marinimicrobia bacterium]|nr:hypothetical protein [Candidatus Neomarinimicrobiota bacterium]
MLETVKDEKGNILAACEFRRVDITGQPNKFGQYVYISNIEISEPFRNNGILNKMIEKISHRVPFIQWVYFKRKKYNNRTRIYPAIKFLRRIKEDIHAISLN